MDVHAKFGRTGFKDYGDMIICVGWGGGGVGGGGGGGGGKKCFLKPIPP